MYIGYLVTIPDFYYGDKYPTDDPEARGTFFANNPFERAYKDLEKVFSDLESTYGKTHVGLQGFCWGGNPALHLAGELQGPSFVSLPLFVAHTFCMCVHACIHSHVCVHVHVRAHPASIADKFTCMIMCVCMCACACACTTMHARLQTNGTMQRCRHHSAFTLLCLSKSSHLRSFPCPPCPTIPANAPHACTHAGYQEGKTIDAAVIPHGSFIKLEAVEAAKAPVLFLFANDEDSQIPGPLRKQIQSVLDSKPGFAGKHYPNQQHGWCAHAQLCLVLHLCCK